MSLLGVLAHTDSSALLTRRKGVSPIEESQTSSTFTADDAPTFSRSTVSSTSLTETETQP